MKVWKWAQLSCHSSNDESNETKLGIEVTAGLLVKTESVDGVMEGPDPPAERAATKISVCFRCVSSCCRSSSMSCAVSDILNPADYAKICHVLPNTDTMYREMR